MSPIELFIQRCDAYTTGDGRPSRGWLSKLLFDDTSRIDHLASGKSDVGVRLLADTNSLMDDLEAGVDVEKVREKRREQMVERGSTKPKGPNAEAAA